MNIKGIKTKSQKVKKVIFRPVKRKVLHERGSQRYFSKTGAENGLFGLLTFRFFKAPKYAQKTSENAGGAEP